MLGHRPMRAEGAEAVSSVQMAVNTREIAYWGSASVESSDVFQTKGNISDRDSDWDIT